MYYVRRDGRTKGPFTREKLRELRRQRRLQLKDEIAASPTGPWSTLRDDSTGILDKDDEAADAVGEPAAATQISIVGDNEAELAWPASIRRWFVKNLTSDPTRPQKTLPILVAGVLLAVLAMITIFVLLKGP